MKKVLMVLISIVLMAGVSSAELTGDITIGANLLTGNNERASASIGAKAVDRTDDGRFKGSFLFNYSEENEKMSTRNIFGQLQYDHFVLDNLYAYVNVEALSDKFKNISLRTATGSGVGYQILDSDDASVSVEGGVTYFSKDVRVGKDSNWYTARLAGNGSIKVADTVTLSDSFAISPKLKDRSDFQIRNEASVSVPLSAQWAVKLSNIYQYDSMPSVGVLKKDITWTAGIGYSF